MREENYWFFRVINNLLSEIRLVVEDQCDVILPRNIFSGDDYLRPRGRYGGHH
jgi:hypothetical protein